MTVGIVTLADNLQRITCIKFDLEDNRLEVWSGLKCVAVAQPFLPTLPGAWCHWTPKDLEEYQAGIERETRP